MKDFMGGAVEEREQVRELALVQRCCLSNGQRVDPANPVHPPFAAAVTTEDLLASLRIYQAPQSRALLCAARK